jgi:hypothetical protein
MVSFACTAMKMKQLLITNTLKPLQLTLGLDDQTLFPSMFPKIISLVLLPPEEYWFAATMLKVPSTLPNEIGPKYPDRCI